jgi:tetratricopeptide (TPR) repeat protein
MAGSRFAGHHIVARFALVPVVLCLALAPAVARADETSDEELAKRYYQLGEELYNRSDYEGALKQFQASYALSKRAPLLYNMARCHESLGQHQKAIDLYNEYLASRPANAAVIEARIANLKLLIKKKQEPATQVTKVEPPKPPVEPPPTRPPARPRPLRLPGWIAVGVGGALIITGIAAAGMVIKKKNEAENANNSTPPKEYSTDGKSIEDSGRTWQNVEIATLVVGGVIAATGAVLLVLDSRAAKTERRAWIAPSVAPGGAMVAAGLRF